MIRVLLDGKPLLPPRAGVARYVEGLLAGLGAIAAADLELEVLRPPQPRRTLPWVLWDLQRAVGRGVDVAHFPFYYPPLAPRAPFTVAIHDVLFLEHPEWFPEGRRNHLRWLVPRGARRAGAVVTFSRASAEAIGHHCGVPVERIRVIPHGVDRTRFAPVSSSVRARARRRHRLDAPFLLVAGFAEPRRGLDLAISAVTQLRSEDPDLELVLVGETRSRVPGLEHAPLWVRRLGRVADEDLAALYGAAEIVVAPSLGEGFDFPLLEALACGAAVVASNIPVHRELFADGVELFASGDAEALANALRRIRGDDGRNSALRAAAEGVALRFNWEGTAAAHVDLWREVAG